MIYQFITDNDLDVGMKKYFRDQIIENNTHILTTCEGASFSLLKSKLTGRYDLSLLFPTIVNWNNATNYTTTKYVCKENKIYKALQNNTNSDPETSTSNWELSDPRDQLLVVMAVRITIYFLTEAVNPRKVPEDIVNDFTSSMEWLEAVQTGKENPDFPLLEGGASTVNWGSNPKLDHYY